MWTLCCTGVLGLSGCFAAVAGIHQEMHFKSEVPEVEVHMADQSCQAPCALEVRRQWASFHMRATHAGQVVAEGPVYRVSSYVDDCITDRLPWLILPAIVDGLLIVPGIVDISMGITEWHPETVVIRQGSYLLEDPCFARPVEGGRR